jgi:hypothetical protein
VTAVAQPQASYRQSLLASLEVCPRRTYHSLITPDDLACGYVEWTGDLGTVVHAVFEEIVRTLYRQGETRISTQEAVEIMYEVYAKSPITLPQEATETLVQLTCRICEFEIPARRVISLESQLSTELVCQDGVARTLTGIPDVVIGVPPDGFVIGDWKSGWTNLKTPRDHETGDPVEGAEYLTRRGKLQRAIYCLLVFRNYPAAKWVRFEEYHLRSGRVHRATMGRDELEHVERMAGAHLMKLERGIAEGESSPVWKPRPGPQCARQCPVALSCPVPQEQRGLGAIDSDELATAEGDRWVVVRALDKQMRGQLKTWHEETGRPIPLADGRELRWGQKPSGKSRLFDAWEPEDCEVQS